MCPSGAVVEYNHPRSVSIRLARQSGWTIWLEITCPECSNMAGVPPVQVPATPLAVSEPVTRLIRRQPMGLRSGVSFLVPAVAA